MAASQARPLIEVRALAEIAEYEEVVRLQKEIWGFSDVDALPVRLFIVARKVGGQIFGAFDGLRLIGFCVALPAIQAGGGMYLHSNMLGVEEAYRNAGVGRMLKLAQRDDALARGIGLIEWTFDPLEMKNAHFNVERLGAVVKRYLLNSYGVTSSGLHGGLPTDRCVAEWHLASAWVKGKLADTPLSRPPVEARIEVPNEIGEMKKTDPARAREIQRRVSDEFLGLLRQGLTVIGVEKGADSGWYLLGRWNELEN